jgi:heme exporter protein C
MTGRRLFGLLALAPAALVGGAVALSPDPSGAWTYPLGQRLLYVHVPLAWCAYVGIAGALVAAGLVLARASACAGQWLRATPEVTTVYASLALGTGLAWSYEFALYDPLADPKVLATAVLVAAVAGLWALARAADPARRDRTVAALTLAAALAVPASYLASRLTSPHPDFLQGTTISGRMLGLLAVATLGFLSLGVALTWLRRRQLRLEEDPAW